MLYRNIVGIFVFTILVCSACNKAKDQPCIADVNARVVKVTAPSTALVNRETDVAITYSLYNGCGQYRRLEVSSSNNTTTILVKARYEGCVCTAVFLSGQTVYKFKAATPGVYYLKFPVEPLTYIMDTITVN